MPSPSIVSMPQLADCFLQLMQVMGLLEAQETKETGDQEVRIAAAGACASSSEIGKDYLGIALEPVSFPNSSA